MAITGIALPSDFSVLFSGSQDKSACMWDCHSGQSAGGFHFDQEIRCLFSGGPFVFVGLPNIIKGWNTQTKMMHELTASNGQVYSIAVHDNMISAGTEDGTILVWKFSSADALPELVASLKGHSLAVFSLVAADRLYSASGDKTLRVWDLKTLQCLQTLHGNTGAVMSILWWGNYLISGSLDNTKKSEMLISHCLIILDEAFDLYGCLSVTSFNLCYFVQSLCDIISLGMGCK